MQSLQYPDMKAMYWAAIAALAVCLTGLGAYAVADDDDEKILVKFQHDYREHEYRPVMFVHHVNHTYYAWVWNPDNSTVITYRNDTYVPDVIHEGHWDIAQLKTDSDEILHFNGSDHAWYINPGMKIFIDLLQGQIDTLQAQNQDLQDRFNTVQYQLDKQAKKINQLEAVLQDGK